MIIAIDPGNKESGIVEVGKDYKPAFTSKMLNEDILERYKYFIAPNQEVVIEMISSYGMAVGQTVFDTCVWIGMFKQFFIERDCKVKLIYRKDVKLNICNATRANDSNIIQALIDRFAKDTPNKGKGYVKDKGYFYGFKSDIWQAYALAVTHLDMEKER